MKRHLLGILIILYGCQGVQTDWTTESTDGKHVTWNGSYDNAEKLKITYHGIKVYREKDSYEWAFKVKITYPKNYSDDTLGTYAKNHGLWTPPSNAKLCMPITKIKYEIFDSDDFLIDSMSVMGECLKYTDTLTFQSKKKISNDLIKKYKYGKVNIEAGYIIENHEQ